VQKFDGLDLKGDYGGHIDASNTFTLTDPHEVLFDMSISFYFQGGNLLLLNEYASQLVGRVQTSSNDCPSNK